MDAITQKAIENFFKNVSPVMSVDIVINDNNYKTVNYGSLEEILSDYDPDSYTMYFPI